MKIKVLLILAMLLLVVGCTSEVPSADDSGSTTQGVSDVVEGNNQFAFDLYNYVDDGNVFYSPYSISTALAMTYEGANGNTAAQMAEVMHYPDDMKNDYAFLYNAFNVNEDYKLYTANALWMQEDYGFLPDYVDTVMNYYGGEANYVDYVTNANGATDEINDWVEDKTNNKIKDIIPDGQLNELTRLVLTNAIYFKGDWLKEFEKSNTYDANFYLDDGSTTTVDMMRNSEEEFGYYENDDVQVLEMLYEGEELSMLVVLPKEGDVELTLDNFEEWRNGLVEQDVNVYFPKFTFETKYFMKETLIEMGMEDAFSETLADFSGMDGTDDLLIDQVIHQAFVEVDEKGTEAAAATAVIMRLEAAVQMTEFKADHPFMFFIQDKETGTILFMGNVEDPSS
jgi:serpin B